jgi:ABC-type spermidine/putrescine transport system permease subunit II
MIVDTLLSLLSWSLALLTAFIAVAVGIIVAMYFKYSRTPRGKRIVTTT